MNSRHHILFERTAWMSRPDAARVRSARSLIPIIDRVDHDVLHEHCPPVPLLGAYALRSIAQDFVPQDDTFKTIDALLAAIHAASLHPRAHQLERRLADVAIESIELQRNFLKGIL